MLIAVDKALKHRVVMLSGDEENPRRRSMTALLEAACPDGDDFDLETVEAEESTGAQWLAGAGTAPFLADRRTVVVRHLLRAGPPSEVFPQGGKELGTLPESALLVLVADDESGDSDRRKRLASARTAWEKAVTSAKGFVYKFDADAKNVHSAVRQECERLGIKISPKATELLIEMTGGGFSRALDELEKLSVYCGGEPIRDADVREVVVPAREWNVFKLVDAVFAGNVSAGLAQLRILVGNAMQADAAANQGIFPNLMRQFRLLWQARVCIEAKANPLQPPAEILACFPEKPNLAKEADWQRQKALRNARRISLPTLGRCMQIVADANAEMIGLLPAYNGMETLEQMVLKMVEAIRSETAR